VDRAQEPAKILIVVQVLQAGPRLIRRRNIDEGEAHAGNDLQDEAQQSPAAKYVKPTAGIARSGVAGGGGEQLGDLQPVVNP
jgi:hypothetical protein